MIISRTPLRISFFGGGTDVRGYYKKHTGAVISTTIDKYIYIIVKSRYNDDKIVLNHFEKEEVNSLNEIKHGIIRECLKLTGITKGIEITSMTDLPVRGTGLGSSSAFSVGLLNALFTYKGRAIEPGELAELASYIEIDILKEPIGKQDQYAAAFGGLKEYSFCPDETVKIEEINIREEDYQILAQHMILFHTGIERKTSSILSDQNSRIQNNLEDLHALKLVVEQSKSAFEKLSIQEIGDFLSYSWERKKKLSKKIQHLIIEKMYENGMKAGAYGGKLLGAGGGGYLLFLCHPNKKNAIRCALVGHQELPIRLDKTGTVVKIFN